MTKLRIFIASPGELSEERNLVSYIVEEMRWIASQLLNVELEAVRYETHGWPGFGADAQDVINNEIDLQTINIFIGMMWRRFGTPTNRADSGTEEEFEKAYQCYKDFTRPHIMLYFRQTPFYMDKLEEIRQYTKVIEFRDKVEKLGAFIWKYDEVSQFERDVRQHLTKEIARQAAPKKTTDSLVLRPNILGFQNIDPGEHITPRPASNTGFIFVSHVNEDDEFVRSLRAALIIRGVRVWDDLNNSRGGPVLAPDVQEAIEKAQRAIVVLSPSTINSPWIRKEFQKAQNIEEQKKDAGYRVIPLLLPGVEVAALETWFDAPVKASPVCCKTGDLNEVLPDLLTLVGGLSLSR
ncbi:MAG TPA: TIR domain-containing protein [Pyrinomonadaceae bacterium]|nr:TIR domain-containing protein [Pyrinomonadaceae bacterium]